MHIGCVLNTTTTISKKQQKGHITEPMSEKNVYQELKRQIILLEQKPGAVIREKEIMEVFEVSRTPVREALMRLEIDGLVRIVPNVGTFVEKVMWHRLSSYFQ